MKKGLFLFLLIFAAALSGMAQQVTIINKTFVINGNASCPVYFNGANTPWDKWNDFGGNYNAGFWSAHFATLKANGINASRVWISCNGDVQPNINTDGTVTGVSAQFWANLDDFFQSAQTNGIYIMATMMSFDHTKNTYQKYQSWRNMLNSQANVQSYCDHYLVPFVNRYKSNPYLMSIDISNEIEWVAEDASNMKCSYAVLQRFVAMCASAVHNNPRTDGTSVLVTLGSAATKWNATKMRNGSNGTGWQNNSDGNKWSDAALKAQYNQANAVLDYYSPHYYAWIDEWYSNPYVRTPADFGIDEKPVLIGETPAGNPGKPNLSVLASYEALKNNGYQGHFPWTSNGVDALGDISKFGADAKTFAATYSALVKPTCAVTCTTAAPDVTTPLLYCKDETAVALFANGTGLKWYADNTTTTPFSTTPVPSTAAAGTTNYYVSQTLGGCEGPRAILAVTVKALPAATITTTAPTTFCAGDNVSLAANTGTGLTYAWKKDNAPLSGSTAAAYSAFETGNYTVTVTANGCSKTSDGKAVTVKALPAATITTTAPTTFCAGDKVSLAANTGTGLTYAWKKDNAPLSGSTAAAYSAFETGNYTVTVTANGCSKTSDGKAVTVKALPTATITTTAPTTFCAGDKVSLAANTGTGLTYAWKKDNAPLSGSTAAAYSAFETGNYTVTVTANGCSKTSDVKAVTVKELPAATITLLNTPCPGGSAALTANTGNDLTYVWKKGNAVISGATAATYDAATSGSYTVTVTSNGCSTVSDVQDVKISSAPMVLITAGTSTTFCTGGSVRLSVPTGADAYLWMKDNSQISGETAASYVAKASGNYSVHITFNGCPATSVPTTVTVLEERTWYQDLDGDGKGDVTVTKNACAQPAGYVPVSGDACPADPDKLTAGDCGCGVAEGTCTDCAGVIHGAASLDVCNICSGGTTGITPVTDDAQCGVTTGTQTGTIQSLRIFPNPSTSGFTVSVTGGSFTVTLYNAAGSVLSVDTYDTSAQVGENLQAGLYVIRIEKGGIFETEKIIKE